MPGIRRESFSTPMELMETVRDMSGSGPAPVAYVPGAVLDRHGAPVGFIDNPSAEFAPGELDDVVPINSARYRPPTTNPEAEEADALDAAAAQRTLDALAQMGIIKTDGPMTDQVDLIGCRAFLGGEAIELSELDVQQIERILARAHMRNLKAQMDKTKELYGSVQRKKRAKSTVQKTRSRKRKAVLSMPSAEAPEPNLPQK